MREFVELIGITVVERDLQKPTVIPGLELAANCILVDYDRLRYPGDLLHEAGHLAVTPANQRWAVGTDKLQLPWPTDGEELGAILWSYAAALEIGVPLDLVFHPEGYKGDANWLIETLQSGSYIGLPFLEWAHLALSIDKARAQGKPAFPRMLKWVRD
jgi:hypothetical protein